FSSAAYDTEVVGMTQIGMLTSEGASYAYGDSEACVTKDLDITYLDANKNEIRSSDNAAFTRYDMLIKKGIKFSDGVDLTIKDVLFNLYLYLDPAYTGSATIYSTDIVGLERYRAQTDDEGAGSALDTQAENRAYTRLDLISAWIGNYQLLKEWGTEDKIPAAQRPQYSSAAAKNEKEILEDIAFFLPYFEQELENNYKSAVSSFTEDLKTYAFDNGEYWQSFLYMYGKIDYKRDPVTGAAIRDSQDRYTFDFTTDNAGGYKSVKDTIDDMAQDYLATADGDTQAEKLANAKGKAAVDYMFELLVGNKDANGKVDYNSAFAITIQTSGSTNTLLTELIASERSKILKETAGEHAIREVSGIEAKKVTKFRNEKTKQEYNLNGEYDVLSITINKIDPKAIWNFAFTVAPLHYYSYPNAGSDSEWNINNNFGVRFSDTDFMNDVVKDTEKLGVPVGAGPYKASKIGGLGSDKYPRRNQFLNSNRIYYERNEYFDTVDEEVGGGPIRNAKIKYYQYVVVNSNFLLDSLIKKDIDVGTPSATSANMNRLNSNKFLASSMVSTNGYGYVGINASFIPDVWLRRAIMKAMDTNIIYDGYYIGGLCKLIYRPMSLESWAYPTYNDKPYAGRTADGYNVDYAYDESGSAILTMLEDHGYRIANNKVVADKNGDAIPELTFTVAGESTDHPAFLMFNKAKEVLGNIGINVKVKNDQFALQKLAQGQLAVWAAAWSSTIDPDMYQVYHKDSTAGSTLNWGYAAIKRDKAKYWYEWEIISQLSEVIDDARKSLDDTPLTGTRAQLYSKALDLVMELAVEMPTYQRNDLTVYNNEKIDSTTLNQSPTAFDGLFSRIWEVGYII
ncbi:MAG: hypothetical protein K2K80_06960, partial [Clostridia bacterium]|nr:hypothetical protein [Clostridia bacterium]